jgi:hypothetical protein
MFLKDKPIVTWIDLIILPVAISLGIDAFSVALGE